MTFIPPGEKISIGSLDGGPSVSAQYNPKELQIDKTVPWQKHNKQSQKGADGGGTGGGLQMEYTGAEGREMTLELMFDGVEENESIKRFVDDLETLATEKTMPDGQIRPHHCVVAWGEMLGVQKFKCVITQISTKYTMFSKDGRALRATVTLKLKEATSVSMGGS